MAPGAHNTNGQSENGAKNGVRNGVSNGVNGKAKHQPEYTAAAGVKPQTWSLSHFRQASRRPLPDEMGDGSYRPVVKRATLMQDVRSIGWADLKTLKDIVKSKVKGEKQQDDKTMIMERTIQLVATMPNQSVRQELLTNTFIGELWDSLDHPPLLYMGDEFRWRQPDGSNNNPTMRWLGAAGTPYSRTVKPGKKNSGALPDPETVYEAVMARGEFKKNPNNVSSILWYWATIIIHDLFWTNSKDGNQNDSSSYLDLSPLYGNSKEALDSIRTFEDGKLKPDTFADRRLLGNPPGVCIILIMFNRFHNHVAERLATINDNNRFAQPQPAGPAGGGGHDEEAAAAAAAKARARRDEELFQTARLVTSGLYINITLVDYVRNIINLNRVDTEWTLDPRQEMGVAAGTSKGSEAGVGNAVSAEFNLCYRWHSCISQMDDQWIQDFYRHLLGDDYGEMGLPALIAAVKKFEASMPSDPGRREFDGMRRGPDGRFDDDDLVRRLATAIEQPGGAFGARNVPRIMKPVEMLGILRGRKWNLAGLNEFRKHFGLKPYATFEDINSDPEVADALRNLYTHPDHVELYPGIVAEEGKTPMVPGVGIAPTYTISRVVLSDAVSLVRGDRHYTTDYHAGYLTQWGFNEANYDFKTNHGCVFYKLFLRAFPDHFRPDSVYAHYPMVIPSENRKILARLARADRFSWERPQRRTRLVRVASPAVARQVVVVGGAGGDSAASASAASAAFRAPSWSGLGALVGHARLSADAADPARLDALLYRGEWKATVKAFYAATAERLFSEKSHRLGDRLQCDIVRDVGNLAHTHFAARLFNLPLKTKDNPKGVFSEQELYAALATIYAALFRDLDPVRSFPLRARAKELASQLGGIVETNVKLATTLGMGGLFTGKAAKAGDNNSNNKDGGLAAAYGVHLVKGLAKGGLKAHDVTYGQVLPGAASMVPVDAQLFAEAVNYYLTPAGQRHADEIHRLAAETPSDEADALLLGYALEGVRLGRPPGVFREASGATSLETVAGAVAVQAGDGVWVATPSSSSPSPSPSGGDAHGAVDDAASVDPRRPVDSYVWFGAESRREVSALALVELFRAAFRRRLRRAPGPQGELKRVPDGYLTEDWGDEVPFPAAMKVVWE